MFASLQLEPYKLNLVVLTYQKKKKKLNLVVLIKKRKNLVVIMKFLFPHVPFSFWNVV